MAEITASLVKELREKTGAGMMDCKRALGETAGDIEVAIDWLRKKGLAAAAKKAGRIAAEGLVGVATSGQAGAVVEVNSETDFVARNDAFQNFVRQVAERALECGGVRRERACLRGAWRQDVQHPAARERLFDDVEVPHVRRPKAPEHNADVLGGRRVLRPRRKADLHDQQCPRRRRPARQAVRSARRKAPAGDS